MSGIKSLLRAKKERVFKALFYAQAGTGKSSLSALAPKPLFISPLENRLNFLDVDGFETATSFAMFVQQLRDVVRLEHDYKTLVIDSVSGLGELIKNEVLTTIPKDSKGAIAESLDDYGWGTGYSYALKKWHEVLKMLDIISERKNMNIILNGHAVVKAYKPPVGEEFNIYALDAFDQKNNSAVKAIMAWCDFAFFMQMVAVTETAAKGEGKNRKFITRALGVDDAPSRVLYTQSRSAFEAKNSNVNGMEFAYEIEGDSGKEIFNLMK